MNNMSTPSQPETRADGQPQDADFVRAFPLPLEIRVHGRGGQGGVTCAKLCALVYANLGLFTQTFGDYGMERAGAPVRAYTRVDRSPIRNRNKVYTPNHVLILDPSLFGEGVLDGMPPGSLVLLNTTETASTFQRMHPEFRFSTVNATAIARKHGIGTAAVVIVNTAIVGAYARLIDLPMETIEKTYSALGLQNDLAAAQEAYSSVVMPTAPQENTCAPRPDRIASKPHQDEVSVPQDKSSCLELRWERLQQVIALPDHTSDMPTPLKTGSWRTQSPVYGNRISPCNHACPAGNDVVGFVQALKQGDVESAAAILFGTQPLPSVCGRVCPAPCMMSCNRGVYDGAVNVRGLERWVGDHGTARPVEPATCSDRRNVAIVGSGPAGLSAAFTLARVGHEVTLYEGLTRLGGALRSGIPSYRLPDDALDRDLNRILALGVQCKTGELVDATRLKSLAAAYDAVIVATGQGRARALDVPGAGLAGVEQGLHFLSRVKSGSQLSLEGSVIVIGGGNTAVDCARTALRCGASSVKLVYRRGREEMPAIDREVEETLAEGIDIMLLRQPVRFLGQSRVTAVEVAEVRMGEPDASGRKRPIPTDSFSVLPCEHVLLAVGQSSELGIFPSQWTIRYGRAYESDRPANIWLAGDLTTGEGAVAHAVGHGRTVAEGVLMSFGTQGMAAIPSPMPDVVTSDKIRFTNFSVAEPHQDRRLPAASRASGFQEVSLGLADAEEAERCLSCGHCTQCDTCMIYCPEGIVSRGTDGYAIDGEYCKGCGICVRECPRNAMLMTTGI